MYLYNKVKSSKKLIFNRNYIFIKKSNYLTYDFKYEKYSNNKILVKRENLNEITFKLDKNDRKRKEKNLKWLFKQKSFINNLNPNIHITFSQLKELKKVLNNINDFSEYFNLKNIALFINNNVKSNFIERHRLLSLFKCNSSLLPQILRYGINEGKQKYTKKFKKGKENPGYKHGGRLSPYSKKFIKYKNLKETEINQKRNEIIKKSSNTRIPNTRIEYYLNKGYTLEESKQLLNERQATFSKEKLISDFGIQGYIRWVKRQEKWKNTLNSKSIEEIQEINMKKGKGNFGEWKNGKFHIHDRFKNKKGILYYFTFFENNKQFWKIGISTKKFDERFPVYIKNKYKIKLIEIVEDTIENCYLTEQMVLKTYNNYRVKTSLSTECFYKDIK